MKKHLLLTLALLGFAGALHAADPVIPPEPQATRRARKVKIVDAAKPAPVIKAAKAAKPASGSPFKLKGLSDDMLGLYFDNGKYYLRYDWDKPAVVYSLSMADNQKLAPGRELMIVQPEGRSKGKIKSNVALRVVRINPNVKPAAIIKKGELIA